MWPNETSSEHLNPGFSVSDSPASVLEAYRLKDTQELLRLAPHPNSIPPNERKALRRVLKERRPSTPEKRLIFRGVEAIHERYPYGFGNLGLRGVAFAIDTIFVISIQAAIVHLFHRREIGEGWLEFLVGTTYFVLLDRWSHTTLGKFALGMEVRSTRDDEIFPGTFDVFIRETVGRWISFLFLFMGYVAAISDPLSQATSDKWAHTVVVKRKSDWANDWGLRLIVVLFVWFLILLSYKY